MFIFKRILILIFINISFISANETIRFSSGAPPNTFQPTIITPILKEVFKKLDYDFSVKYHPSLRSLTLSNSGKYDGELHRVYDFHDITNYKYNNLLRIDTPLLSVWVSFFTNQNSNIIINEIIDLKKYKVAYYRGRKNVEKILEGIVPTKQIYVVNTDEQAFKMLNSGRVDIVITEENDGNNLISINGYHNMVSSYAFETRIYSYINKKHQSLLEPINQVINKMKESGEYDIIYNRALLDYYK